MSQNHKAKMTEDGFTLVSKKSKKYLKKETPKEYKFSYKTISNLNQPNLNEEFEKSIKEIQRKKYVY